MMKSVSLVVLLTSCGSAGEMITDAGKCTTQGNECRQPEASPIPGPQGPQGPAGTPGTSGAPGKSCSVTRVSNGALIECPGAESVVVLDGARGADGAPAPATPYTVTEVIDPCGTGPGFNEVLLRLGNGQILAHYASGATQFLTLIGPGNYVTTDGQACYFTVHSDMTVTW